MFEAFERAAFSTQVGQVSPVVRTDVGFHIIKVTDRRQAAPVCGDAGSIEPFRNELFQEELERQMKLWVEELRKKAFVEVRI